MSDKDTVNKPVNFIRHQINDDLNSGLHSTIQTRFPPEPNGIYTLAMQNQFVLILVWHKTITASAICALMILILPKKI